MPTSLAVNPKQCFISLFPPWTIRGGRSAPPQHRSRFEHGAADRQKPSVMDEGLSGETSDAAVATPTASGPPALPNWQVEKILPQESSQAWTPLQIIYSVEI